MKENRFKLTNFTNIETEEVEWLWYPYFPLGSISFLAGDPGIGKTFITTYLASVVSKGGSFAFSDKYIESANVLIQNGEDLKGATIKKRLESMDADVSKINIIELKEEKENEDDLLLKDIDELDDLFNQLNPKLVIFDPITNFLGDIDMNNAVKVVKVLKPISKLASKYNCSIIFVIHRNKGMTGVNSIYRLLGSIAIAGIARSIISISANPNNKDEKIFIHTKHNLSEPGLTLAFKTSKDNGVIWLGTREYLQDDEVSNQVESLKSRPREKAKDFIVNYLLENEKLEFSEILAEGIKQGITEKTLIRARDELKEEDMIDKEYVEGKYVYWHLKEVYPDDQLYNRG